MAEVKPQPSAALVNHHSTRMVFAFRYGALAIAGIGLIQAVVFTAIGSWVVVAMELAVFVVGLTIYLLVQRGHLDSGVLAGQAALMMIVVTMGLVLDVPTAEAPRISHLYLLVLAALGYLNYQRRKSGVQLALIALCLLAFVALASSPLAFPSVVMPEIVRTIGTCESGGAKLVHGSGGIVPLRAAQKSATYFPSATYAGGLRDLYRGTLSEGPPGLF